MTTDLSPGRRQLADALTALIMQTPPGQLDGDTLVAQLTADRTGRAAVQAAARDISVEDLRVAGQMIRTGIDYIVKAVSSALTHTVEPETGAPDPSDVDPSAAQAAPAPAAGVVHPT